MARSPKDIFADSRPALNMSAMIDLVFLLLIFFMVASKMITVPPIEGLEIPVASAATVPKDAKGRVVIHVTRDARILNPEGTVELTVAEVESLLREAKALNPRTRLLLRSDQEVEHGVVKQVIQASAKAGVTDVVFSTYQTD